MSEAVDRLNKLPFAGSGLSLVTLREFQRQLAYLTTDVTSGHALVRIGYNCQRSDRNPLAILLRSVAETNAASRLPPGLVNVIENDVVCLLSSCTEAQALKFARMVRAKVQTSELFRHAEYPQLGIGIVPIHGELKEPKQLLTVVEQACREAERKGNNAIEVYRAADRVL